MSADTLEKGICRVPECERPVKKRGVCNACSVAFYSRPDSPKGKLVGEHMLPATGRRAGRSEERKARKYGRSKRKLQSEGDRLIGCCDEMSAALGLIRFNTAGGRVFLRPRSLRGVMIADEGHVRPAHLKLPDLKGAEPRPAMSGEMADRLAEVIAELGMIEVVTPEGMRILSVDEGEAIVVVTPAGRIVEPKLELGEAK